MKALETTLDRLEQLTALDEPARRVAGTVGRVSRRPAVASTLAGTPLGHPLHPVLTDLPIGCWTSAFVLDLLGGPSARRAARTLTGLGVLTVVPTALTGLTDWADTEEAPRRVGAVHALVNAGASLLYASSWLSRRRGHHGLGVGLALAGAGVATVGAHLGGHLVYRLAIGVDVNAGCEPQPRWTPASARSRVVNRDSAAEVRHLHGEGADVLATRDGSGWLGIGARCSHRGGPLQDGAIEGRCVRCPWHGSRFTLDDGAVVTGPATAPQPRFDVTERDGSWSFRERSATAGS